MAVEAVLAPTVVQYGHPSLSDQSVNLLGCCRASSATANRSCIAGSNAYSQFAIRAGRRQVDVIWVLVKISRYTVGYRLCSRSRRLGDRVRITVFAPFFARPVHGWTEDKGSYSMKDKSTRDSATILGYLAAAALWIALLGPAWAYIPATSTTPAANMNFADFVALNAALSPGGLQHAFYSWGAWLFAILATMLAIFPGQRRIGVGVAAVALGIVQLVVSVLAIKGEATAAMMLESLPYTRVGSVLYLSGIGLLIASGVVQLVSVRASRIATIEAPVPVR